jgi:polyisoprenoid-binding protein YceI
MKLSLALRTSFAAFVAAATLSLSADVIRYQAAPGSKITLDGTSTVHDWTVESGTIGGFIEFQSDVPLDPSLARTEVSVTPKVQVIVPVSSLKSGKTLMDDIMHDNLKMKENPRIKYVLNEMKPKEHKAGEPFQFDTKGDLTVAGVTKPIEMVVTLAPIEGNKLKATGLKEIKMTDFGMKPPAPSIGLGLIKTADEVKVTFEWITARKDEKKTASSN